MDWKKHSKWWVIGAAAAVILINAWAIYNEHLFIPFFSVAAIIAYLLLFRVDLAMYLMAFSTPFSIGLDTEKVQFNISLPAELLMISLTFLFLDQQEPLSRRHLWHGAHNGQGAQSRT